MTDDTGPTQTADADTTTIYREPFEVIARSTLQDSRLTFRARGLLAYMLSKPPGWRFASDRIAAESLEGRDAVRVALNELVAAGYLRRTRGRGGNGTIATTIEIVARPALMPPATGSQAPVAQASKRAQVESTEIQPLSLASLAPPAEPGMPSLAALFDAFWQDYPRKVGKRTAKYAYGRAVQRLRRGCPPHADPHHTIMAGLQRLNGARLEPAYVPHPTTWLNRDGWEDHYDPPVTRSTGIPVHGTLERALQRAQAAEEAETRGLR